MLKDYHMYSKIVEKSPTGYAYHEMICDKAGIPCDYRYLEVNKSFEDMTGMKGADIIGKTVTQVLPGIGDSAFDWIACYGEVALNGVEKEFEQYSESLDRWYKVTAFSPEPGTFITCVTDLSHEYRQIRDLKQVSQTSEELLSQLGGKLDYQKIADTMLQISDAKIVLFNRYNPQTNQQTTVSAAGDKDILKQTTNILGEDLIGRHWKPDSLSLRSMRQKTMIRFPSLFDFTGRYLPEAVCDTLTSVLGVKETIAVTVKKNKTVIGDFTLLMPENMSFEKDTLVEIYARQIGLAIERNNAEKTLQKSEKLLNNVFQSVQDGMCVLNTDLTIRKANRVMEQLYSQSMPLNGKACYQAYQNRSEPCEKCPAIQAIASKKPAFSTQQLIQNDQQSGWLEVHAYPLLDHQTGAVDGVIEFIRDITWRKTVEQQLLNEEERFRTTLMSVGDGVISTDDQGRVVLMNAVAEKLTGWPQAEAKGQPIETVFHVILEDTRIRCDNLVEQVLRTGHIVELGNHTALISKNGAEKPIADSAAPIRNDQGDITGVVLVFRDLSERKQHLAEVEHLAYHDYLTGAYNRRYFEDAFARLNNKENQPLAIILGDINGIKMVNDSLGHHAGDLLIKEATALIKAQLSAGLILARMGGDKFGIILTKSSEAKAAALTNQLETVMNQYVIINDEKEHSVYLSISFGCSVQNEDQSSLKDLMIEAEDYVYKRKYYNERSNRSHLIKSIMGTLFQKSPREQKHSRRVGKYCRAATLAMQCDIERVNLISVAASLHDIGKIGISEAILNKPGKLTAEEWDLMKQHPVKSATILSATHEYKDIANIVAAHHEHWDGSGYPSGLKGKAIPVEARIIAVADAYDAMTHDRTYRTPLSEDEALHELMRCAGTQFDPDITTFFVDKVLGSKHENKQEAAAKSILPAEQSEGH